jgi:hypothetical protein
VIYGQTSLKFSARLLHALPVRFLRDAPAAASICHNVALVSDLSRTDQNYFYAMEFVGGKHSKAYQALSPREGEVGTKNLDVLS